MQRHSTFPWGPVLTFAVFLLFSFSLVHTAWLSDDAFISFRTVENVLRGHGAVWNPGERVQSYSHPLWFLLVLSLRAMTGELYGSVMALSLTISLGAMALVCLGGSASWWRRAFLVLLATSSVSFMDFSTSGLENPLSHLLAACFFLAYVRQDSGKSRPLLWLGFIAGLAVLNRQDAGLLYLPPLIHELAVRTRASGGRFPVEAGGASGRTGGWRTTLGSALKPGFVLVASMSPFIAWTVFSVIYYGFPFPNTAYAKLATGIPRHELIVQGLAYVAEVSLHDPVTPLVIVGGIAVGLLERSTRLRVMAGAVLLQVAYVIWVGGDFMSGRFFSLPFFVSLFIAGAASLNRIPKIMKGIGAAVLGLAVLAGLVLAPERAPLLSAWRKPEPWEGTYPLSPWKGIIHERNYYYPWTGLLRANRGQISPDTHRWTRLARRYGEDTPAVLVLEVIGLIGWEIGDRTYIVDPYGLSDPLLARLPCIQEPRWRIGHFLRRIPEGYVRSLIFDDNRLTDRGLAAYYDDLRRVTRGPLFTRERWAAIWRLNTGSGPQPGDRQAFTAPGEGYKKPARRHYRAEGFVREDGDARTFEPGVPFAVHWSEPRHGAVIEIVPPLRKDCGLEISRRGVASRLFVLEGRQRSRLPADDARSPGYYPIPAEIARRGYDALTFVPGKSRADQRIRSIRVIDPPVP